MDIFKENPNLDVAYRTTDGNYFPTRNGARTIKAVLITAESSTKNNRSLYAFK